MAKVDEEKLLKEAVKEKKLVIGTEQVMKLLKKGKLKKVYLSSNCPEEVVSEVEHYSKLTGVTVVRLERPNKDLGTFCKKPFSVSVLGLP
ncbi:ribosomal L7Ae/L30e/S12e/Gadd45 family protein [Nanoarchaeota archaeon]